eukprot:3725420-Alexandrium_andersonii.AAC.1
MAPLHDPNPTSTRAEVYAIATALLLPCPVSLATDSLNAARRLSSLLLELPLFGGSVERVGGRWFSPKLAFVADGDLWAVVRDLLIARGTRSVSVKK